MPNTLIMFHAGIMGTHGNPYEAKNMADFDFKVGQKCDKIIFDRINEKRNKDNKALMAKRTYEEMSLRGKYMFADEAIDMGLADRIEHPVGNE